MRFTRKTRKKLKVVKTPPNGQMTDKEQWARQMRHKPTPSEERLVGAMRRVRYENGWVVNLQVVLGPYIADILLPNRKVVVEVDGSSHYGRAEYDHRRDQFLTNSGFKVCRVTNDEVWADLGGTVGKIISFVELNGRRFKGWKHPRI